MIGYGFFLVEFAYNNAKIISISNTLLFLIIDIDFVFSIIKTSIPI